VRLSGLLQAWHRQLLLLEGVSLGNTTGRKRASADRTYGRTQSPLTIAASQTASKRSGYINGDGVLMYPGEEKLPSRSGSWNRRTNQHSSTWKSAAGTQDHQYLTLARQLGLASLVNENCRQSFREYSPTQKARLALRKLATNTNVRVISSHKRFVTHNSTKSMMKLAFRHWVAHIGSLRELRKLPSSTAIRQFNYGRSVARSTCLSARVPAQCIRETRRGLTDRKLSVCCVDTSCTFDSRDGNERRKQVEVAVRHAEIAGALGAR